MAESIEVLAPRRPKHEDDEAECIREVHAQFISLGGAVILSVCIVLTLLALMSLVLPTVTNIQRLILFILTVISWAYLLDSVTEKLRLIDKCVEYRSIFTRPRIYRMTDLEGVLLVHQGFNLERGFESIEFRRSGLKPDRISLGPCWQRNKLEKLMHSLETALNDPHLFEEVR